jgi:hypothetical protein
MLSRAKRLTVQETKRELIALREQHPDAPMPVLMRRAWERLCCMTPAPAAPDPPVPGTVVTDTDANTFVVLATRNDLAWLIFDCHVHVRAIVSLIGPAFPIPNGFLAKHLDDAGEPGAESALLGRLACELSCTVDQIGPRARRLLRSDKARLQAAFDSAFAATPGIERASWLWRDDPTFLTANVAIPPEPTISLPELWCSCRRPDDGDLMVECDHERCPNRWFHAACVGLDEPPDGGWLCPTCSVDVVDPAIRRWCICRRPDDGSTMIQCDGPHCLYKWYHLRCIDPPLPGSWICPDCLVSPTAPTISDPWLLRHPPRVLADVDGPLGPLARAIELMLDASSTGTKLAWPTDPFRVMAFNLVMKAMSQPGVVVCNGRRGSGRTACARACLSRLADQGAETLYVDCDVSRCLDRLEQHPPTVHTVLVIDVPSRPAARARPPVDIVREVFEELRRGEQEVAEDDLDRRLAALVERAPLSVVRVVDEAGGRRAIGVPPWTLSSAQAALRELPIDPPTLALALKRALVDVVERAGNVPTQTRVDGNMRRALFLIATSVAQAHSRGAAGGAAGGAGALEPVDLMGRADYDARRMHAAVRRLDPDGHALLLALLCETRMCVRARQDRLVARLATLRGANMLDPTTDSLAPAVEFRARARVAMDASLRALRAAGHMGTEIRLSSEGARLYREWADARPEGVVQSADMNRQAGPAADPLMGDSWAVRLTGLLDRRMAGHPLTPGWSEALERARAAQHSEPAPSGQLVVPALVGRFRTALHSLMRRDAFLAEYLDAADAPPAPWVPLHRVLDTYTQYQAAPPDPELRVSALQEDLYRAQPGERRAIVDRIEALERCPEFARLRARHARQLRSLAPETVAAAVDRMRQLGLLDAASLGRPAPPAEADADPHGLLNMLLAPSTDAELAATVNDERVARVACAVRPRRPNDRKLRLLVPPAACLEAIALCPVVPDDDYVAKRGAAGVQRGRAAKRARRMLDHKSTYDAHIFDDAGSDDE